MTDYAAGGPNWRLLHPGEDYVYPVEVPEPDQDSEDEPLAHSGEAAVSYAALTEQMSDEERAAIGVRKVSPDPIPDGQRRRTEQPLDGPDGPYWPLEAIPILVPEAVALWAWTTGLRLWMRDGTARLDDVQASIAARKAAGDPLGIMAEEMLARAQEVQRGQLMAFHDTFGFSTVEVDESLWRASRVLVGDLSGVWPLPEN